MSKRSIVHVEIPASVPADAAKFYAEMFGLELTHDETFDYHMFGAENMGGGFVKVGDQDTQVGDVVIYFASDDLSADLAKIESMGGKRLGEPVEIPGMGSMAHFTDPTGNHLALWHDTSGADQ